MKKTVFFIIVLVSLRMLVYSQSFNHQFHSELIDLQLSVVKANLVKDGMMNSNMFLIPIFDVDMESKKQPLHSLTKNYLKSLKFLTDNDSISAQDGKDCFYLSEIIAFNNNTNEIYEVRGDKRFPSPREGMNLNREFIFSEIYNKSLYYLISYLYINNCIDYIFKYPTHWSGEKVVVEGIFFAIKNDVVFVLSDHGDCPRLFLLDDYINNHWDTLTGIH